MRYYRTGDNKKGEDEMKDMLMITAAVALVAMAKSVAKLLTDAIYLSKTPPQGSWRTFNFWSWYEKELSIVEALKRPIDQRSIPGDKSDMKRIDYIYVSPGTTVLDYRTVCAPRPGTKLYPSDHFPSVATLVFK